MIEDDEKLYDLVWLNEVINKVINICDEFNIPYSDEMDMVLGDVLSEYGLIGEDGSKTIKYHIIKDIIGVI